MAPRRYIVVHHGVPVIRRLMTVLSCPFLLPTSHLEYITTESYAFVNIGQHVTTYYFIHMTKCCPDMRFFSKKAKLNTAVLYCFQDLLCARENTLHNLYMQRVLRLIHPKKNRKQIKFHLFRLLSRLSHTYIQFHVSHKTGLRPRRWYSGRFLGEPRCVKSAIYLWIFVFQQLVGCGERLSRSNKFVEPFTARSTCHRSLHVYGSGWQYNSEGWLTLWATRASI